MFLWWGIIWRAYLVGTHESNAVSDCVPQEQYDLVEFERDNIHSMLVRRSELIDKLDSKEITQQQFLDSIYKN